MEHDPQATQPDPPPIVRARPAMLPYAVSRSIRWVSPLTMPDLPRRSALLDFVLVILVLLIGPLAMPMLAEAMLAFPEGAQTPIGFIIVDKWLNVLLAGGVLTYFILRQRIPAQAYGVRRDDLPLQVALGLLGVVAMYGWMLMTVVVIVAGMALMPGLEEDLKQRVEFTKNLPVHNVWQSLALLIPVALHEELLFRSLMLPYLRRLLGSWWLAIFASSAIFGALHITQGAIAVLQILGVGAVLALFFIWSRSLLTVAIAHFLFNFLQFQVIQYFDPRMLDPLGNEEATATAALLLTSF